MITELKIPAHKIGENPIITIQKNNDELQIKDIHQAWRYGIKINSENELEIIKWLYRIKEYIESRKNQ